ncbi:MAG: hypothetical protein ACRC37_07195, partial [Lentisphaeria bacterium]
MNPKRNKTKSITLANLLLFWCITLGVGYAQETTQFDTESLIAEATAEEVAIEEAIDEAYEITESVETASESAEDEESIEIPAEAGDVTTDEALIEEAVASEVINGGQELKMVPVNVQIGGDSTVTAVTESVSIPEPQQVVQVVAPLSPLEQSEIARRNASHAKAETAEKAAEEAAKKGDFATAIQQYGLAVVEFEKVSKVDPVIVENIRCIKAIQANLYELWAEELCESALKDYNVNDYQSAIDKLTEAKVYNVQKSDVYQARIEEIKKAQQRALYITSIKAKTVDPEKPSRDLEIKTLWEQGNLLFRNDRMAEAEECFDGILRLDPYNTSARVKKMEISKAKQRVLRERRAITVSERINAVTEAWVQELPRIDAFEIPVTGTPVEKPVSSVEYAKINDKLDTIIIKNLKLNDATIPEVVTLLTERSKMYDEKYGEGVNILLNLGTPAAATSAKSPNEDVEDEFDDFDDMDEEMDEEVSDVAPATSAETTVTSTFNDMPLRDVFKYLCELTGLKWRVDKHAVLIARDLPLDTKPEIKFYDVRPGFIQAVIGGAGSSTKSSDGWDDEDDSSVGAVDSDQLKKGFKALGIDFPSGTSVTYNGAISKLVVNHSVDTLNRIQQIINELDKGRPLINIQAKFAEIGQTDINELGFEWMITKSRSFGSGNGSAVIEATESSPVNITSGLGSLAGLMGEGYLNSGAGNVLESFLTIGNTEFKNVIRALDKKQNIDVLSAPEITTLSGEEAEIKSITKRYFPVGWTEPEAGDGGGGQGIDEDGNAVAVTNSTPSIP